jgi:hypothetical protein
VSRIFLHFKFLLSVQIVRRLIDHGRASNLPEPSAAVIESQFWLNVGYCGDAGAGYLGDLHVYNTVSMAWTDISAASGIVPSPRRYHGFAAAGGKLYVHGGVGPQGEMIILSDGSKGESKIEQRSTSCLPTGLVFRERGPLESCLA